MKSNSIILLCALVVLASCTKSKEVHPELGDGNDEIITVGVKDVHVEYLRTDHEDLQKVVFHYSLAGEQQFKAAEMTKRETFFELTLNDLVSDMLYSYYYELFPINGNAPTTGQKTFHTQAMNAPEPPSPPTPPSDTPEGAINGLFTINANGDQVYFSQGNLQYQASTNTWRFAEHQWDYVGTQNPDEWGVYGGTVSGSDNSDISQTYSGWIDLFGWGTSGYNHGANCYQPWSTSSWVGDYYAYGNWQYNLYDQNGHADWGYNSISNGGTINTWRTLKGGYDDNSEWHFLFNSRNASMVNGVPNARFAKACVNGVHGMILFPDSYTHPNGVSQPTGINDSSSSEGWYSNNYSIVDFQSMAQHGAVFLPAAGVRAGTYVYNVNTHGYYWSASYDRDNIYRAYMMDFQENVLFMNACTLEGGLSVRLVQDANH